MWSYRRLYWLSASAYRGRSWHRDISMNRRRSAAPARMRNKSSGAKNTVCSTSLSAAPFLAFTPLTVMLRRLLRLSRMSVTNSRWRENICPTSSASCLSKPINSKLYFDYGNTLRGDALYTEQLPGGFIQVCPNTTGEDSKLNIEALFNAVHNNKELIKAIFNNE